MGLTDKVFGTPGTTTVHQAPGSKDDPGYGFAKQFFNFLGSIMGTPYPTYKGSIDPGLSPTMQDVLKRAQGYASSSPPEILQGVQGSLGRFMSPNFLNPVNSLFGGAPNYFGVDPNQRVYGGAPASSMTWDPTMGLGESADPGIGMGMGGGGMMGGGMMPDSGMGSAPTIDFQGGPGVSTDMWQQGGGDPMVNGPGAWGPGGFTPGGQPGPNQMTYAIGRRPMSMPFTGWGG